MTDIFKKIQRAKKRLLEMHYARKVGHIGGNLSVLDSMMVLHHDLMKPEDRFVLSKGHSAGALYITLWSIGRLSDEDLNTFHADNTTLAGHPMTNWMPEIPFSTGSLGHGFSLAAGLALGRQLTNTPGHVYCITSDGEWQEGSNWEALIFFAHHKLTNLTLLIDFNGLQGFGTTHEVASMSALAEKITAFNIKVVQVDGHNPEMIKIAIQETPGGVVILNTIKGSGVSFMENRMEWHYLPMNTEQYQQAIIEVDNA